MGRVLSAGLIILAGCRAASGDEGVDARMAAVETGLLPAVLIEGEAAPSWSIEDRMAHHKVPGVSVAVFSGGKIEWARGYGVADVETGERVTAQTLFQAASISKPVAATAALALVERGLLDLDENVNAKLASWKVPENAHTAVKPVTLRGLVSHTAGMTVHGFPGYAAGSPVPTTVEVLDGSGPANTAPIRVDVDPGTLWRYSGGGYTVMQLLLEAVTGQPFAEIMAETILAPFGMENSTYEQPLPADRHHIAASGHKPDGSRVAGNWHTYPEMAAAGLWTTPSDLARFAMELQQARMGESNEVLSRAMVQKMLEPGLNDWGLGPQTQGEGTRFGHGGANEGFRCTLTAYTEGGRGIAVMTNSDNGGALAQEIIRGVADVYAWKGMEPQVKTVARLDPSTYPDYAGRYLHEASGTQISVAIENGKLWLTLFGSRQELLPESDSTFFTRDAGNEIAFVREGGPATEIRGFGGQVTAKRIK